MSADPSVRADQSASADQSVRADQSASAQADQVPGGVLAIVEAVLLASPEPVTAQRLAQVLDVDLVTIQQLVAQYSESLQRAGRGVVVQELAGGWQVVTRPDLHEYVSRGLVEESVAKLSQAALETLAVVAYQQPVTRSQITAIRGVNVDGVVRTLLTRGLIEEVTTGTESVAKRYGTTSYFLQRMGLASLDDLPPLAPHLPDRAEIQEVAGDLP